MVDKKGKRYEAEKTIQWCFLKKFYKTYKFVLQLSQE